MTAEFAKQGKRSLKVIDASGLRKPWDPHFYFEPNHTAGVTHCAFDLRLGPAVVLRHEWRDNAAPYRTGPSLLIQEGKLLVNGKELLPLPAEQWIHFDVSSALGDQGDGTWDLTVTLPRMPARHFSQLKCGSPDWRTLNWLGFVSLADATTVYYLDDLQLSNSEP